MDWTDWRKTIDQTVADRGQWVGLCDGWGKPIMEMPPIISMSAANPRLAAGALELVVNTSGGRHVPVHPVVDAMVADGLGVFDAEGRLIVKDDIVDMVVIERPGSRRGYVTSFPTARNGATAPTELLIQGTSLLDRLAVWPCPSVPQSWTPEWQTLTGDVVEYTTPRTLGMVDMAVVADGYTMDGPAEATIRTLVQDSLDAVNHACGWTTPHLVVDMAPTGNPSPRTVIRVQDAMVWETIAEPAQLAGVNVDVDLWWPGDDPVLTRPARGQEPVLTTWDHAIGVVRIEQIGG